MNTYAEEEAPPEIPENLPQHDMVAEQSVLGGMLLQNNVIDDVMGELMPPDFYQPKHELIARAIATVFQRNEVADPITVADELRRTEKLARAGGDVYLHQLTSIVPTAANAGYYARVVHELAVKRRLVSVGQRIQGMGNASEGDVAEMVERANVELASVVSGRRKTVRPMGESFLELIEDLDTKPEFLPSPWESLNKLIGGFAPGGFYVIAARPGAGKSIAALQCAAVLAHYGMVAFSSLEMTERELQKRLIAQFGPVHMGDLRNHTLSEDQWLRLREATVRVKEAPIFVDEDAGATMASIRAHARAVGRKGKLSAIIIDYLQLVSGEGRERREIVDELSRQAKQLAKDMNVPVIAAAQLKRAGARKGLPGLEDLREAGGIEQNADVVLLLDRDPERKPDDLTVVVGKNRHGNVGKFTLQWQGQFARLRDKTWSPPMLFEE